MEGYFFFVNVKNLIIKSYEYARLSDSGLNGFISLLSSHKIKNIYLQFQTY